ncbi:MAG: hydroxysqualene dehydroxylase HpnE [Burkholderiales bacterium]|nr:hydroxysqualene dehydroxylase HpnE [Burkholderiales bacterium]
MAVIGAGWAGCAAAVHLCQQAQEVYLIEASRTAGGRARQVHLHGKQLDNGQHILLGAYSETLRILQQVGIRRSDVLHNLPLQMIYPENEPGMHFIAPRFPAPLHVLLALWRAKGLSKEDKLALARFSTTARWMTWRLDQDCSVAELLQRFGQTEKLCRLMWVPLCIAALNTPPERASAQVFLNVLRDSLGANRAASDMLIPKVDLSSLFPRHAITYLEQAGGQAQFAAPVRALYQHADQTWHCQTAQEHIAAQSFDAVIIATDYTNADRLLKSLPQGASTLPPMTFEPITTCYLQYDATLRLPLAMAALIDQPAQQKWGQYVFDRGQLNADQAGLIAVVVSASQAASELSHAILAEQIARQIAGSFGDSRLATPMWHKIITEKRATFSCSPSLQRPQNATGIPGLFLAGDYTAGDYPATLEGAVRSGLAAARAVLNSR